MKEIIYPISIKYREHWNEWEAIREIVQNALDSDKDTFTITKQHNDLIVIDKGKGLQVKHLLFGISEKENPDARGQFGEGLKIALIVLKRLGYETEIISNDLHITVETTQIENEKCLKLCYQHNGLSFNGTKVIIHNYKGETYEDRFILNDKDVLFKNEGPEIGGSILKNDSKDGKLYVKDIYIQDLKNSVYSYNLKDVRLEESRNIANDWDIKREIGRLWVMCTNKQMWKELFKAFKNKKYESCIWLRDSFKDKDIVKEAFNEVFPNTVLYTNDTWKREAEWRHKNTINIFPSFDCSSIYEIIETDKQFVLSFDNGKDIEVKENQLTSQQYTNLLICRNLVKQVNNKWDIKPYIMSNASGKSTIPIKINIDSLTDIERAISVTIHELTHLYYGTEDMTENMIYRLADMGALILKPYIENSYETRVLMSKINLNYEQYRISIPKDLVDKLNLWKGRKVNISITKQVI